MVKKLKSEDFLSELAKFYSASKEKYSVYLTIKRLYEEKQKYKKNSANRKLRIKDRLEQDKENKEFNILVRAKLRKQRVRANEPTMVTEWNYKNYSINPKAEERDLICCHFLLQGLFPTQGSNLELLRCRQIL